LQLGLCNCKPKFSLPGPRGPGASKAQPPRGLVGHCTSGRPLNPPLQTVIASQLPLPRFKAPLFRIVSGAISSELALPFFALNKVK